MPCPTTWLEHSKMAHAKPEAKGEKQTKAEAEARHNGHMEKNGCRRACIVLPAMPPSASPSVSVHARSVLGVRNALVSKSRPLAWSNSFSFFLTNFTDFRIVLRCAVHPPRHGQTV